MTVNERRRFFRERVDLDATLYVNSSDEMRRSCRLVDLGGGGGQIEISSAVAIDPDGLHEVHFSLPNRPAGISFSCELVALEERMADDRTLLHMRFVKPLPGYQDSVISYVQNRKHLEKNACKVAMPVCMDPTKTVARGESCLGMTIEAGRTYAVAEFRKPTPPVGSDVLATFLGPRIIKETSVGAKVEDVTRTLTGFRLRLAFDQPTDQVLDFARRYYAPKRRVSAFSR